MKSKKGISETITIILFVLIAIAAVAVVWAVLKGTINSGTNEIGNQAGCLGISLDIVSAKVTGNEVNVTRRGGGDGAISNITFIVDGKTKVASADYTITRGKDNPNQGESLTATFTNLVLVAGKEIKVAAKVGSTVCPIADNETIVA